MVQVRVSEEDKLRQNRREFLSASADVLGELGG